MPPRKQPSGAANRKARAAREEVLRLAQQEMRTIWSASRPGDSIAAVANASQQFDPNGPATELPIYGVAPTAIVGVVNSAILALEQGMFFAAAYLADGMTRDDRLKATLDVRIDAIVGAPVDLEPAKDTQRAQSIADDCETMMARMLPFHQVAALLRNGLMLSVGIGQVLTERTKKSTEPTFRVWNNRYLRFDWMLRRYCLVTQNRGEIVLEPDDPEWIIYEPFGPYGWLNGALMRSVALPWLIRYWSRTWWARHQEVHGHPIRVGIIPADRDPADEKLFLKQLSNISHEAVIRLPQGAEGNKFDVKLVEATANTWKGFESLLVHCDDSIAVAILGQRQSTAGQGGLGTQENAGEETILKLSRKDARVYEVLREKVLKPWCADNYGDEDMAPHACPEIEPPEDVAQLSSADLAIAQTLVQFKTAGAPVDQRKYLETRGYGDMLMTEEEHEAAKQEAMEQAQQAMTQQPTKPGDDKSGGDDDKEQGKFKRKAPGEDGDIYGMLEGDFPKEAIEWVKGEDWDGPEEVDLDDIDWQNAKSWHAATEPKKVARFMRKIKDGWKKPVVLVHGPAGGKYRVIDGHHRALAYKELKQPAFAFTAEIKDRKTFAKALEMHDKQGENEKETMNAAPTVD